MCCNHFTTFFHSFSMLVYCAFYILKCNECAQTAFVMRLPFPTCDPMYVHCAVYTVCEWNFFYFFQQALHSKSCLVWISSSIHLQCMNWNRLIAKTIKAQEISPSLSLPCRFMRIPMKERWLLHQWALHFNSLFDLFWFIKFRSIAAILKWFAWGNQTMSSNGVVIKYDCCMIIVIHLLLLIITYYWKRQPIDDDDDDDGKCCI